METAYEPLIIDPENPDPENLKILDFLIKEYKDLQAGERELNNQIAKNQKMQTKIFFFFGFLFCAEIIYSLLIGSGYVEPIKIKVLMLVFITFLMCLAYSVFRK